MKDTIFAQLKIVRKGSKPLVWRRVLVPIQITFSQLALVLDRLLDLPVTEWYEFEFYKADALILEIPEDITRIDFMYSRFHAPETYVDEWLKTEKSFTFRQWRKAQGNSKKNHNLFLPCDPDLREVAIRASDSPEYKVEVEHFSNHADISYENDGVMEALCAPAIIKEHSTQADHFDLSLFEVNRAMKAEFTISKGKPLNAGIMEIRERVNQGKGLEVCQRHGKHREKYLPSFGERVRDAFGATSQKAEADVPQKEPTPTAAADKHAPRFTMKDVLNAWERDDLLDVASGYGMDVQSLENAAKSKIIHAMQRFFLTPDVMRVMLARAEEEAFKVFEKVFQQGRLLPTEQEKEKLVYFVDIGYVGELNDGYSFIPEDVAYIYEILRNNHFHAYYTKAHWLLNCADCLLFIELQSSLETLYKTVCQKEGLFESYDDFYDMLTSFPKELVFFIIEDGYVINRYHEDEGKESILELRQQLKREEYVPSPEDVETFMTYGYDANDLAYQELFDAVLDLGYSPQESHELCYTAYLFFMTTPDEEALLDGLVEMDVIDNKRVKKRFKKLLHSCNLRTRTFFLKGHRICDFTEEDFLKDEKEFFQWMQEQKHYFSSEEAGHMVPRTKKPQMTFSKTSPDLPDELLEMPTVNIIQMPAPQPSVSKDKKVYPNDPCPCGSGKKYKHCCGRKKK